MNTRSRRSRRGLLLAMLATLATGVLIEQWMRAPPTPVDSVVEDTAATLPRAASPPANVAGNDVADTGPVFEAVLPEAGERLQDTDAETRDLFEQGVALLRAGDAGAAANAFHGVLARSPRLPEAHVNLGFALLAANRTDAARDRFLGAIDLRRSQVNAYWGLAVALERGGDLRGALGAMRSFVHLSTADDPFLPRARAALWEWQATLDAAASAGAAADDGS